MTIETPSWWEYAVIDDADGVGIVKGFKKDVPKDVLKEYKAYMKELTKARLEHPEIDF